MKKLVSIASAVIIIVAFSFFGWEGLVRVGASIIDLIYDDPDYPRWMQSSVSKEEFMLARSEGVALKRGIRKGQSFDPAKRIDGLKEMQTQESARLKMAPSRAKDALLSAWTPIGPAPIRRRTSARSRP